MATTKTFVIRTVQSKPMISIATRTPTFSLLQRPMATAGTNSTPTVHDSGARKRRRLTHLSPEEKMMRRKLKNRVAAQTARDRKKVKMEDLEGIVAQLEEENRQLQNENNNLKERTGTLALENINLRQKLASSPPEGVTTLKQEHESPESAVLAIPLPQEQIHALFHLMTHSVALMLTLSLMHCWGFWKSSPRPSTSTESRKRTPPLSSPTQRDTHPQWWGPQQRSWNPSMNS